MMDKRKKYSLAAHCYLVDMEYAERSTTAMGLGLEIVGELLKIDNNGRIEAMVKS